MFNASNISTGTVCGALRDLVPFAQFKKCEKHPWRNVTFRLKPATLLKVTLLHGCFSRFLSCAHGKKSRNAPHVIFEQNSYLLQCFLFHFEHVLFHLFITTSDINTFLANKKLFKVFFKDAFVQISALKQYN